MAKIPSKIYRVTFYNQNTIYELYAKGVDHSELYGFIEVSGLVFGATSGLVVDPAEERLKSEFAGVDTTYIPLHSIIRIDGVEKEGVSKISEVPAKSGNNVAHFPVSVYTPKPSNES
jgi:hypothetical protein